MWASGFGGAPSVGVPAVWLVGFPELGTATTPSVPSLWLWDLSSLISLISWVGKFQTASALPGSPVYSLKPQVTPLESLWVS